MTTYLDHAATTPMRPEALSAMLPFLTEHFGNPSGSHAVSRRARRAVDDARQTMAELLGAEPGEVVFTSGGTEADNLALRGVHGRAGGRVVCSSVEHRAVLDVCGTLGGEVAPVGAGGAVDLDGLESTLNAETTVVSVMLVNNEVGVCQPLEEVIDIVRHSCPRAVVHTDAVQAFPWVDVAHLARDADLVSVSAHKFGGPKGVGALVVRGGAQLEPLNLGGGQERTRRSGTHNVAGIVGMAAAARVTAHTRADTAAKVGVLRDTLVDGLLESVPGVSETGERALKVAGNCHVGFEAVESEELLYLMDEEGICASAGSACASGATEPSHVLTAMGLGAEEAAGCVRMSLGYNTTEADVDHTLEVLPKLVGHLRSPAS